MYVLLYDIGDWFYSWGTWRQLTRLWLYNVDKGTINKGLRQHESDGTLVRKGGWEFRKGGLPCPTMTKNAIGVGPKRECGGVRSRLEGDFVGVFLTARGQNGTLQCVLGRGEQRLVQIFASSGHLAR